MSAADKKSIASELEQLQTQLYDLMNSKNADGEYIFGGNQSQTQPFVKNDAGDYEFKGDTGQRMIQVAPSVQIAANDSGLSVFQQVATRRTLSATTATDLAIGVSSQSEFDSFFRNQYDFTTPANNQYTISTTASPDQYQITGNNGYTQSGDYIPGEAINFNGVALTMTAVAGSGPAQQFNLDAPTNDNVLNSLNTMIDKLKNSSSLTDEEWASTVANVQTHINNTLDRVGITQGAIGGRQNNLEQIIDSNSALETITAEARANVSEIDLYEAISNVSLQENALTMAQQAFTKVNASTLFDYL